MNEIGSKLGRGNDMVQGAHAKSSMHTVDTVELIRHLTKLLGVNNLEKFVPLRAQPTLLCAFGPSNRLR